MSAVLSPSMPDAPDTPKLSEALLDFAAAPGRHALRMGEPVVLYRDEQGTVQALLDRSWLWHGSMAQLRRRLTVLGDVSPLQGDSAVVMLAPHFVGLDAGGTALTMLGGVRMASIYVPQSALALDDWVRDAEHLGDAGLERHRVVSIAGLSGISAPG